MLSVSRKQQKAEHQAKYRTLDLEEQQINRKQEKEARYCSSVTNCCSDQDISLYEPLLRYIQLTWCKIFMNEVPPSVSMLISALEVFTWGQQQEEMEATLMSRTGVSNPRQPKHTASDRSHLHRTQRSETNTGASTNSSSRSLFIKREINMKGQMEVSVRKALACRGANVCPLETLNKLPARFCCSGVDRFVSHHLSLYGRFCYINCGAGY